MKKRILGITLLLTLLCSLSLCFADDKVTTREGDLGDCHCVARNKITENLRTASATTSITGSQSGTSASVTATLYYINTKTGGTGSYHGGNGGQYGGSYSQTTPDANTVFYRVESSHTASYNDMVFSVPNLVTTIP